MQKTLRSTIRGQKRQLKTNDRRLQWLKRKRANALNTYFKQRLNSVDSYPQRFTVPETFSIHMNREDTLKFISKIKRLLHKTKKQNIFISFSKCCHLTNEAIALLISAIGDLKVKKIKVSGNYPRDKRTKNRLEQSGFFNFVDGLVQPENRVSENTIVTQGIHTVDSEAVAPLVLKAMKTVFGERSRNPKVQGLLVELMANSVNHAFKNRSSSYSKWYLSIYTDEKRNKVSFTFIDNGQGIIKTLKRKFIEIITTFTSNTSNEVLKAAFEGRFGSQTLDKNRGRGLPNIKKCFSENYISNLIVISNDICFEFKTEKGEKLKTAFDGTFYHWDLDLNCKSWNLL